MEQNKQQTAVDWLVGTAFDQGFLLIPKNQKTIDHLNFIIKQAKGMEEERAMEMYIAGMKNDMINPLPDSHYRELAEQYYEETYGKQ